MSAETMTHLNTQTLIGYTSKRGHAWHYRAEHQGAEPNHYEGPVPTEHVERRLFHWSPVACPLEVNVIDDSGVQHIVDDSRKVIVRPDTGTVLGVFRSGYQVHDYREWLVENVSTILDAGELAIGSAGLLRGGAVAWVQVELEDTLTVQGVEHRPFLTAATSLDGSLSTTYQTGTQVVVCDNTLSDALGERTNRVKIRHSRHSVGRLSDVRDALQVVHGVGDTFDQAVRDLTAEQVNPARWSRFIDSYTGRTDDLAGRRARANAEAKADALHRLWTHDERVAPWSGTAYGVVAACNTWLHHESKVRGSDRATRNAERVITGDVEKFDRTTLRVLASV